MKKYPFLLIEMLIAIALLALCAFPLISEPLFAQKQMREKFFELELERKAEQIYYEVLQKELSMQAITTTVGRKIDLEPIEIVIEGLGTKTFPKAHYHLYHCKKSKTKDPYYNIFLGICFKGCQKDHMKFKYKFNFLGKVIDQKNQNLQGEKKVSDVIDEEFPSKIYLVQQSM